MAGDLFVEVGIHPDTDGRRHVVIQRAWERAHIEEGTWCWCEPRLLKCCFECSGSGCSVCGGDGVVDVEYPNEAVIVVHQEAAQ